jgi:hypothetical protein
VWFRGLQAVISSGSTVIGILSDTTTNGMRVIGRARRMQVPAGLGHGTKAASITKATGTATTAASIMTTIGTTVGIATATAGAITTITMTMMIIMIATTTIATKACGN